MVEHWSILSIVSMCNEQSQGTGERAGRMAVGDRIKLSRTGSLGRSHY